MLRSSRQPKYYVVPVVERTLDIMELLKETCEPMKVAAISDATGIARSTAYRILRTLVDRGYVSQNQNAGYGCAFGLDDHGSCRIFNSRQKISLPLAAQASPKAGDRSDN